MDSGIHINDQLLKAGIPVVAGLIAYMIYWFAQESDRIKEKLMRKFGEEGGSVKLILGAKYLGAITLGILPFMAYRIAFPDTSLKEFGVWLNNETALMSLLLIIGLGGIMVLVGSMLSKSPNVLAKQPEIRIKEWPRSLLFYNLLAWAVYLLGYEFFFRGVLLFPLVESIGMWPAIGVNVIFYAGVHIPKGADEVLAAVPLAIVLCLLTVKTGTIWIAYFVHVAMAWTVTLSALKHQANMRIINSKR